VAFREQEIVALCSVCKEVASEICARCNIPMCESHAPGDFRRCEDCEEFFKSRCASLSTDLALSAEQSRIARRDLLGLNVYLLVSLWALMLAVAAATGEALSEFLIVIPQMLAILVLVAGPVKAWRYLKLRRETKRLDISPEQAWQLFLDERPKRKLLPPAPRALDGKPES
jgi:hypothetical protein